MWQAMQQAVGLNLVGILLFVVLVGCASEPPFPPTQPPTTTATLPIGRPAPPPPSSPTPTVSPAPATGDGSVDVQQGNGGGDGGGDGAGGEEPTMPDLVGLHVDVAMGKLTEMHIAYTIAPWIDQCEISTVVSTEPPAGAGLLPEYVVRLDVCSAAPVPSVVRIPTIEPPLPPIPPPPLPVEPPCPLRPFP